MTYRQFWTLLQDLGLERALVRGSHIRFTHAPTETVLLFPLVRGRDRVQPRHLVPTRFILDANGLIPRERWDARVRGLENAARTA